jgi:hypothetical protein
MLCARQGMTVHKDGSVSRKDAPAAESRGNESRGQDVGGTDKPERADASGSQPSQEASMPSIQSIEQRPTTLTFPRALIPRPLLPRGEGE